MKRKFLSIFLALAMCLSLLPTSALAAGERPQLPAGTLKMRYDGSDGVSAITLPNGTYTVELFVEADGSKFCLTDEHSVYLTADDTVVQQLRVTTIQDGGNTVKLWEFTVAGDRGASGAITYTAPNSGSTSSITVTSTGSALPTGTDVDGATQLYASRGKTDTPYMRYERDPKLLGDLYYVVGEDTVVFSAADADRYFMIDCTNEAAWKNIGTLEYVNDTESDTRGIAWELPENYWEGRTEAANYIMMIRKGGTWYTINVRTVPGERPASSAPYLKMECGSPPQTSFSLDSGNYEVRFYIESGNNTYPPYPTPSQLELTCTGAVTSIGDSRAVTGTENGVPFTAYYWTMTVSETAGSGSISGKLIVDETTDIDLGSVSVTSLGKKAKSGTLAVQYNGTEYIAGGASKLALRAGRYELIPMLRQDGNRTVNLEGLDFVKYGGCITNIETDRIPGANIPLWVITVSDTGDTGYIRYGESESNRVTIMRKLTYGAAVQDADRVQEDERYDDVFHWDGTDHGAIAVPFTYGGRTYYLGACCWEENGSAISPKGHGSRGLENNENSMLLSVRVFDLLTGSVSDADASYGLREDIRRAMLEDGYNFKLVVRPTWNGCRYYPAEEKVTQSVQIGEHTYTDSEWSSLTFDKNHCAGCWVFEGQLWKGDTLIAGSTGSERMSRMDTVCVTLTGATAAELNTQIADALANYTNLSELEYPHVEFALPGGELTGELIIPATGCFVSLCGAGARDGEIKTTIKGGIRSEVQADAIYIHFVGAGKAAETTSDGKPNSALYGKGEGIPRQCILEDYYCAVQSEMRTVWGANSSVFRNNHIGIRTSAAGDGNLQLQNSWFVGNDIALQVEDACIAAITPSGCCFVNNGEDLRNSSRYDLWLSGNFFYHASVLGQLTGGSAWEPVLWTADENGAIRLNFNGENHDKIVDSSGKTPKFNTQDYFIKDAAEQLLYAAFLPMVTGASRTFAMPLACTTDCTTFYYPRFGLYKPVWWELYPIYPYVMPKNQKVTDAVMDAGAYVGSEDANGTLVIFDFGAGRGNTGRNEQ